MKLKFVLNKIDPKTGSILKTKEFKTLGEISNFLKIDYQNTQKFYKLCQTERDLKGLHTLLKELYKNYRIVDNISIMPDFELD
jgi:hypothetical protein